VSSQERLDWLYARQEAELVRTGCIYCGDKDPKEVVGMDGPVWCGECNKVWLIHRCRKVVVPTFVGDTCDD
jgi:hypothetical protein